MDDKLRKEWCQLMALLSNSGMHDVYLLLTGLARSDKHLEEMHEALPDNCRLMREDFIILRRAWRAYWQGEQPRGKQMSQIMTDSLVSTARGQNDLCTYYTEKLGARKRFSKAYSAWSQIGGNSIRLFSRHIPQDEQYSSRFVVWILGIPFLTECIFAYGSGARDDNGPMFVRMAINRSDLTEPMVHKIRSQEVMMSSYMDDSELWSSKSIAFLSMDFSHRDQTSFVFRCEPFVHTSNLRTHLRPLLGMAWSRADKLLLRGGCDVLKNVLIDQTGLPISRVGRVVDAIWRLDRAEVIKQGTGGSRYGIIYDD